MKQIIDDSLFSVTDYCWVYFGVRMFCISVGIVMLSSYLAWMYALIQKVITNHNMWPIFGTNVSLRLHSYFRLFLLHGHLKVMRAMNIWTRYIGGYKQECRRQGTRFIMYILDISRSFFFFELTFEINHKKKPTLVGNWVSFLGFNSFFLSYLCPCYFQYHVELDHKNIESIVVQSCHRCYIFIECWYRYHCSFYDNR